MGTGYTRNDTVNNIADGNVINASDLDGEFDAIQAAFNESTGHTHDGTSAEGAPITKLGPAQDVDVGTGAITPKIDNTVDLGSGSLEFKDLYIDGTANIDSLVADTADINAGTIDGTVIGGSTPAAATVTTLTVNGNTTLGDAATDTVTFTADVASNVIPSADDTYDLGAVGSEWKDLYVDGTANIDSLVADTADINAGTIDGVTIGGAAPGVGTFTTANATTVDATNIEVTNIKAKDGSASATIADSTGVMTIGSAVLTTADINGGTADNVVIGGATAAAGTFTTVTASGNLTVNGNTTLGNAATDTVTVTADVASNLIPSADNTYDLGASGSEWKDLYIDGTANIDSLVADTADINGGTIDGTTIGGASAAVGTFTQVNVDNLRLDGNAITSTNSNGNIALTPNGTGEVDISKVDIDSGSIDGTAIGGSTPAAGSFTTLNTSGAVVFNDAGADVDFRVEGDTDANLLFVDASTNRVGIGTNTPASKFGVVGQSRFYGSGGVPVFWGDTSALGGLTYSGSDPIIQSVGTNLLFYISSTEAMRIDSSGNVGIGTSTITTGVSATETTLTLKGNSSGKAASFVAVNNAGTGVGYLGVGSNDVTFLSAKTNNALVFSTNDTERMRITSGGAIWAGNTTRQSTDNHTFIASVTPTDWTVNFQNQASSGAPLGIVINYSNISPNNTGSWFLRAESTGIVRCDIRSNGGIANYSANDANLSDRREKTNFAPAKNYLETICAIPIQTFNYIDQNLEEDDGLTLGVVAQDVQEVAPELVMESNWGTEDNPKMRLSIYQTDLQYALMKCIQELKAELDTVKAELATLKG